MGRTCVWTSRCYPMCIQEWGLGLPQSPVALVCKPKPAAGRDRRLSKQEEERLLEVCQRYSNPLLYWIVILAIETGMRKARWVTLTRRQIDLQKRMIYLQQRKNGTARSVPLSKTAVQVLEAAINHPVRPIDTDLVFWGDARDKESGKRKPYDFIGAWNQVREKVRLQDLRFHDLRHEAVSRLVEAGLSDLEVSTISGHKSMQMLKRYTHLGLKISWRSWIGHFGSNEAPAHIR